MATKNAYKNDYMVFMTRITDGRRTHAYAWNVKNEKGALRQMKNVFGTSYTFDGVIPYSGDEAFRASPEAQKWAAWCPDWTVDADGIPTCTRPTVPLT